MRNNNLLKIVLGILFAAAGLWLLWRGWLLLNAALRTGPAVVWILSALTWGGLLRFTVRHYKHLW